MINEADAYLYVTRKGGRNQVASALTATSRVLSISTLKQASHFLRVRSRSGSC